MRPMLPIYPNQVHLSPLHWAFPHSLSSVSFWKAIALVLISLMTVISKHVLKWFTSCFLSPTHSQALWEHPPCLILPWSLPTDLHCLHQMLRKHWTKGHTIEIQWIFSTRAGAILILQLLKQSLAITKTSKLKPFLERALIDVYLNLYNQQNKFT